MQFNYMAIFVFSLVMLVVCSADGICQGTTLEKEAKTMLKEIKKKGMSIYGASLPEQTIIEEHIRKVLTGDFLIITPKVTGCITYNICKQKSRNDAVNELATLLNSKVIGFLETEYANDAVMKDNVDKFKSKFQTAVSAKVGGLLELSYSLSKEIKGAYDFESIYLVEKKSLEKELENALKNDNTTPEEFIKKTKSAIYED
jgi:hypothetical protein